MLAPFSAGKAVPAAQQGKRWTGWLPWGGGKQQGYSHLPEQAPAEPAAADSAAEGKLPVHGVQSPFSASLAQQGGAGQTDAAKESSDSRALSSRHSDSASSLRGASPPSLAGKEGVDQGCSSMPTSVISEGEPGKEPGSSRAGPGRHVVLPVLTEAPGGGAEHREGGEVAGEGEAAGPAEEEERVEGASDSGAASIDSAECISTADIECGRMDSLRTQPDLGAAPPKPSLPAPSAPLQPQLSATPSSCTPVVVRLLCPPHAQPMAWPPCGC